ncbi:Transcription initiation factor TFIID subunit 11 [Gracilariopsis chorda]|uniref:Transcription initiation factor TFIID subunit 11 n=1 Tax=Gracilariopsis chorda TaxID=448386 RepID=A0A2V3IFQ2_9FLOR|nr:Transcription initiation factor TFIID subunit 11 [Gracilariopsis chorda]|eukprot:PXF40915.1 Transcription initiation factor TFIID subunit 11 [Gracilariopsis chorda]
MEVERPDVNTTTVEDTSKQIVETSSDKGQLTPSKKPQATPDTQARPNPQTATVNSSTAHSGAKGALPPPEVEDPDDEDAPLDLMKMREFEFSQVSTLTPAQLRRYEQYRRSDLKSVKVRKVLTALNPMMQKASDPYVIAVKGLAKLFVGDVVETALEVRKERGEVGALTPKQIREAYRRLRNAGAMPCTYNGPGQANPLW